MDLLDTSLVQPLFLLFRVLNNVYKSTKSPHGVCPEQWSRAGRDQVPSLPVLSLGYSNFSWLLQCKPVCPTWPQGSQPGPADIMEEHPEAIAKKISHKITVTATCTQCGGRCRGRKRSSGQSQAGQWGETWAQTLKNRPHSRLPHFSLSLPWASELPGHS